MKTEKLEKPCEWKSGTLLILVIGAEMPYRSNAMYRATETKPEYMPRVEATTCASRSSSTIAVVLMERKP